MTKAVKLPTTLNEQNSDAGHYADENEFLP